MCDRCQFLAEAEVLPFDEAMGRLRDHLIARALRDANGNIREAARILDTDRRLVQRWRAAKSTG
ncbi:hypothetical protein BH09MYX1_BH09MYX1_12550 [soil metagenome]